MNFKKYISEFLGTFVLTLFGCGSAVVCGGASGGTSSGFLGVLTIAIAFGLTIVAAAYAIGDISGCHINPAVSFAMLILKKLDFKDFIFYVIFQILGALTGSAILYSIVSMSSELDIANGLGQNGYGGASAVGLGMGGAILVEIILTFVFILTIIGVTSNERTSHLGGLVIGFALTLVHIMGIPLTGTSVNPARSLAPAIFLGGEALSQVWVFIFAPLIGAALAALASKYVLNSKKI